MGVVLMYLMLGDAWEGIKIVWGNLLLELCLFVLHERIWRRCTWGLDSGKSQLASFEAEKKPVGGVSWPLPPPPMEWATPPPGEK